MATAPQLLAPTSRGEQDWLALAPLPDHRVKLRPSLLSLLLLPSLLLTSQVGATVGEPLSWVQAALAPVPVAISLPPRPPGAPTGSEFGAAHLLEGDHERYQAAVEEVLSGNLPHFLRALVPVTLEGTDVGPHEATIWVMPDYLALGSEADFLRIPLDLYGAAAVARGFGFALPTRRMVDAIYQEAALRLTPAPLPPTSEMRSMPYVLHHEALVEAERAGRDTGELIAGHSKDLVLTPRLFQQPGRVAIYGWHQPDGRPIQPLSLVHGAGYADYSHGVRLIARVVVVDGVEMDLFDALADAEIAPLLSDEGPIPGAASLLDLPWPE